MGFLSGAACGPSFLPLPQHFRPAPESFSGSLVEVPCQPQRGDRGSEMLGPPRSGRGPGGGGVSSIVLPGWSATCGEGERPLLSHCTARRPSRGHGPWHELRNPTIPHYLGRFQLPQQGAGLLPSRTGHIWNPLPRGVGAAGFRGRAGSTLPGISHSCAPGPAPSDRRGWPGASVAVGGQGEVSLPSGRGPPREEPGGAGECLWLAWSSSFQNQHLEIQCQGLKGPEGRSPVCGELRAREAGPLPEALQCPGTKD